MTPFVYHRPTTTDEAVAVLREDEDAKLLAGGQSLLPTMRLRLATPATVIDLSALTSLAWVREGDVESAGQHARQITIGAMTTHADVAASAVVRDRIPALADLANHIGDRQVRNRGTLGGSLANNDPAACYPAAALALGATVHTTVRDLAAHEFFDGLYQTALAFDELITAITFQVPRRAAYVKFNHPASRFAIVGVFVSQSAGGARVAVTGAGASGVFRVTAMEEALDREFAADALGSCSVDADTLMGDLHASAEYRAHLIPVLARRAVKLALLQEAGLAARADSGRLLL